MQTDIFAQFGGKLFGSYLVQFVSRIVQGIKFTNWDAITCLFLIVQLHLSAALEIWMDPKSQGL